MVFGSLLLTSCSVSVDALNGKIEKQIAPTTDAPRSTRDAILIPLPDGDLLSINSNKKDERFVVARYDDTLATRWGKTIPLMDYELENLDWNAIDVRSDSVCIFSTLRPENNGEKDSSKYFARTISLKDGSYTEPRNIFSFPVADDDQAIVKTKIVNTTYGRLFGANEIRSYHTPDRKHFLITTISLIPNSNNYYLSFSLFTKDLVLKKKTKLMLSDDTLGEKIHAVLPSNDGNVLISTFNKATRVFRSIRYAMMSDERTSELRHTFEKLEDYEEYSFQFSPVQSSGNVFYAGVCVYEPPSSFITTGNSDFGAFYLGKIDQDKNSMKFTKYALSETLTEELFDKSELQNIGLRNLYVDEAKGRIVAVFEEFNEITTAKYSTQFTKNNRVSSSPAYSIGAPMENVRTGSVTTYYSNNILLAAFDNDQNLIWQRGIRNQDKSTDHLVLGCRTSTGANNTLHLWYPLDNTIHYFEYDIATGRQLSDNQKQNLLRFKGPFLYLTPFSILDKNDKLVFLTRYGNIDDSHIFKVTVLNK